MEVCHLLWELYRKYQVPSSLSPLKEVCIICCTVKFTTNSQAVTALFHRQHCCYNMLASSLNLYILTEEGMATSNLNSDIFCNCVCYLKTTRAHFLYLSHTLSSFCDTAGSLLFGLTSNAYLSFNL
jgi:hypothetical protein